MTLIWRSRAHVQWVRDTLHQRLEDVGIIIRPGAPRRRLGELPVPCRQKRLERWPEELAKAPAGMTMEIGAINAEESKTETLAKDADYEGCKVKEPVTIRALRLTLKITVDGKVDDDGETMRFVKFGDKERWYYFKL